MSTIRDRLKIAYDIKYPDRKSFETLSTKCTQLVARELKDFMSKTLSCISILYTSRMLEDTFCLANEAIFDLSSILETYEPGGGLKCRGKSSTSQAIERTRSTELRSLESYHKSYVIS